MEEPRGKDINKIWKTLLTIEEGKSEDFGKYLDFMDELASKLSGLTVEELNELRVSEKAKITDYIKLKAKDTIDFMKPSLKQAK